jgi:hypothetical protein
MVITRKSARVAGQSSSPPSAKKATPKAGSKRKADGATSPVGKRGKKIQKTLEETMPEVEDEQEGDDANDEMMLDGTEPKDVKKNVDTSNDLEMRSDDDAKVAQNGTSDKAANGTDEKEVETADNDTKTPSKNQNGSTEGASNGAKESGTAEIEVEAESKSDVQNGHGELEDPPKTTSKEENVAEGAIGASAERKKKAPSNIVEKGIIYFLTRGRVGIEAPDSVQDLQRTYFVLRPIPIGAKIGEGAVEDSKANRLFALPKKVLPKSGKDRFMAFVEKSQISMKELKEEVFKATEYETKTLGTRVTPHISPIGEGVYAITETGRDSHLVYMLTIPEKPEEVQEALGLREKGSFILSLKNPNSKGPANASLPEKPDYPQDIIDDFRGLSWMAVHKSKYLDYPNAQILLIGEGQDKFGAAVEQTDSDKNKDKETPQEELEKLEDEDQLRVEHLHGDDTIFDDLHIDKKEYAGVMTTW